MDRMLADMENIQRRMLRADAERQRAIATDQSASARHQRAASERRAATERHVYVAERHSILYVRRMRVQTDQD